jgi:N-carbamoyl-L-amino-acid hydrolase
MNRRQFTSTLLAGMPAVAWQAGRPELPRVHGERLNAHLDALADLGKTADGGNGRVAYSDGDREAREFVMRLMAEARLQAHIDVAGNIVGRRPGREPALRPLIMGSHIDSVPDGGHFDGQVGSIGAIEVAQTLAESALELRHPLEVVIFQNEEGGTVGSRAVARGLTEEALDVASASGKTVREGIRSIGGDPQRLAGAVRKKGDVAAYLELHVEQGGILAREQIDIGVVEGIVGVYWWDVTVEGFANHAGTTPMDQRQDALLAAARYIDAVNRVVTSLPGRQVGTVGRITAVPGAYNVVPGRVTTSLGLRDLDESKVQRLYGQIRSEVREIEAATRTRFTFTAVSFSPPSPTDARVRAAIEESARALGLTARLMPSGAGHDAQEMAAICPIGMIFVPSRDGISHSPLEYSAPEHIANGADVLLQTVLRLDSAAL